MSEKLITELSDKEVEEWTERINNMSHVEMCKLWRFAPVGNPIFNTALPLYEIFKKRFDEFGGFTPAISKQIGLG